MGISRRKLLASMGMSGAGLVGWSSIGSAMEPGWRLAVRNYQLAPRAWNSGPELKIGVIADVHAGGPSCRRIAFAPSAST